MELDDGKAEEVIYLGAERLGLASVELARLVEAQEGFLVFPGAMIAYEAAEFAVDVLVEEGRGAELGGLLTFANRPSHALVENRVAHLAELAVALDRLIIPEAAMFIAPRNRETASSILGSFATVRWVLEEAEAPMLAAPSHDPNAILGQEVVLDDSLLIMAVSLDDAVTVVDVASRT